MVGAVRIMAIQAALLNRGMAKNKRTALIGMTLKANLIDRILFQERIRRTAMRIVAVAATHLTLEKRHMRALTEFYTLLLMTPETRIMNCLFG